jgi:hypothetical protein
VKWVIEVTTTPTQAGWACIVRIGDGSRNVSEHAVDVTTSDLNRLAPGSSVEDLLKRSFEFLLEREPPQSILRKFALPDIERYFPDYPKAIRT